MRIVTLLALSLSLAAAPWAGAEDAPAAQGFYIRPHLNNITTDGCTLIWETQQPEIGQIDFGSDTSYGQTVAETEPVKVHRLRMTGLSPESTYAYKVVSGADVAESTFKTAPGSPRPITFIMIGDSRRWGNRWEETKMEAHAAQWNPEFYVTQGDLVPSGHEYKLWTEHFNRFKGITDHLWMVTARGNHEGSQIWDPENDWFARYHELPGDGEPYAAFTWGNTHFVLISFEQTAASPQWLNEHLPKVDAQYTILAHHFPVYCSGYYSPDDSRKEFGESVMRPLAATINKFGVTADLSGHTHIYERMYPLRDGKRNDREGTLFLTNGGDIGGNFAEATTAQNDMFLDVSQPTYTVFHMGDDQVWFRTFAWSESAKEIVQIDYAILWKDEAVPQATAAKLATAQGDELVSVVTDLGAMLYSPAAPQLAALLKDGTPSVRQAAAKSLGLIGSTELSTELAGYLSDEDLYVRREVARAMETGMDIALTPVVARAAADPAQDAITRVRLLGALQLRGVPATATSVYFEVLQQADAPKTVRERAAYGLTRTVTVDDIQKVADLFKMEKENYVLLRLGFTLNELSGRRQSLDSKAPIGKSKPGEERQAFIDTWLNYLKKQQEKKEAA